MIKQWINLITKTVDDKLKPTLPLKVDPEQAGIFQLAEDNPIDRALCNVAAASMQRNDTREPKRHGDITDNHLPPKTAAAWSRQLRLKVKKSDDEREEKRKANEVRVDPEFWPWE